MPIDKHIPEMGRKVIPWLVPLALIIAWHWTTSVGLVSPRILPSPKSVFEAAIRLTKNGELLSNLAISGRRAAIGLTLGGSIGFVLGLLTGIFKALEKLLDSSIQMVRTIPALALIPLAIVWFGIGEEAKVFLIAVGVFFPIYLNTYHGIRTIDPGLIEMGQVYGLSRASLIRRIVIPGALPSILVGLRFSLGITWLTLIAAEAIAAESGIGYMTTSAREFMQMDVVVLGTLLYALIGKVADSLCRGLERRLLAWHPAYIKS